MTEQEINEAIAEWMGWKAEDSPNKHSAMIFRPDGTSAKRWELLSFGEDPNSQHEWVDRWLDCSYIPNYYRDLNAIHEAEKKLRQNERLWEKYVERLDKQFGSGDKIHASAPQRCEALLRTIGKWKDQP